MMKKRTLVFTIFGLVLGWVFVAPIFSNSAGIASVGGLAVSAALWSMINMEDHLKDIAAAINGHNNTQKNIAAALVKISESLDELPGKK